MSSEHTHLLDRRVFFIIFFTFNERRPNVFIAFHIQNSFSFEMNRFVKCFQSIENMKEPIDLLMRKVTRLTPISFFSLLKKQAC